MPRRPVYNPDFFVPQGTILDQRKNLNKKAAANPLQTGTPEYYAALNKLQQDATNRVANYATRASSAFKRGNTNTGVGIGGLAINSSIQATLDKRILRNHGAPITPYTPAKPPPPYIPPHSSSPVVTSRPTFESASAAPDRPPMHPPGPPPSIKNSRSTFAKICNTISCGLFRSRRKRRGGRRTIRKRRAST